MHNLSSILPLAFLFVTFLIVLISALVCSRKRLPYSLSRIGCTIVAAVISLIGALALRGTVGTRLYDLVISLLDSESAELLDSVSSIGAIAESLIALLVAPLLFFALFIILFTLISVVSGIALRALHLATPKKSKEQEVAPKKSRFLTSGLWIGVAHGLILSVVLFAPLCGYVSVVSDTLQELRTSLNETDNSDLLDNSTLEVIEMVESTSHNAVVKGINNSVGKFIFTPLTSGSCTIPGGETFTFELGSDLPGFGRIVGTALSLVDQLEDLAETESWSDANRDLLERRCDEILSSKLVCVVGADLVHTAATNWSEDKSFAGMEIPETEPVLQPTVQVALNIFKGEDSGNLGKDVHTIIELVDLVADSGILDDGLSNEDLMSLLGSSKSNDGDSLLKSAQSCLRENPHMSPLADEIDSLSVRVVALVLDQSGLNDGKYDEALDSVASIVNEVVIMEGEERSEFIKVNVKEALSEHEEIDIPDDVAVALCEKVIDDLAAEEKDITGEDLKTYLTEHAAELTGEVGEYVPDDFNPDDLDPDDIDDFLAGNSTETLPESLPDDISGLLPEGAETLPESLPSEIPSGYSYNG